MNPKVYRIPSGDDLASYLVLDKNPLLFYSGKITKLNILDFDVLMDGSQFIETEEGLNFIIPTENIEEINYSYSPILIKTATIVAKEINPRVISTILEQIKTPEGNFMASEKFIGPKQGYVFTTKEQGTGYYKDITPVINQEVLRPEEPDMFVNKIANTEEFLRHQQYHID